MRITLRAHGCCKQDTSNGIVCLNYNIWRGNGSSDSEKGVALIVVIILSAVALAVASALIYLTMTYTRVSGHHKAYADACDASRACGVIVMQLAETRGASQLLADFNSYMSTAGIDYKLTTPTTCMSSTIGYGNSVIVPNGIAAKLMSKTSRWIGCNKDIEIDAANNATYDIRAKLLGTNTSYYCYGKIVSATEGNSGSGNEIVRTSGVVAIGGSSPVVPNPFLYTIEVMAEQVNNPKERCRYSILFEY
jgi:hypothetical protein